jgi:hypothetical protein
MFTIGGSRSSVVDPVFISMQIQIRIQVAKPKRIRILVCHKVLFLHEGILKVGKRSKKIFKEVLYGSLFERQETSFFVTCGQFHAHGSRFGSAFPIQMRIQDSHINAEWILNTVRELGFVRLRFT